MAELTTNTKPTTSSAQSRTRPQAKTARAPRKTQKRKSSDVTSTTVDSSDAPSTVEPTSVKKAKVAREKNEKAPNKPKKEKDMSHGKVVGIDEEDTLNDDMAHEKLESRSTALVSFQDAEHDKEFSTVAAADEEEEEGEGWAFQVSAPIKKPKVAARTTRPKAEKLTTAKIEKPTKTDRTSKAKTAGSAEKKEKTESLTGDAAVQCLMNYLEEQNRPYNGTDIIANLHGKVKKSIADKLLVEMANQGKIMGKLAGKSWIFWCIQDPKDATTPSELSALDTGIKALRDSLVALKIEAKTLVTQLQTLRSSPTLPLLSSMIATLEASNATKQVKLKDFTEGNVQKVDKEQMGALEKEWQFWQKKALARKKCFREVEGELLYIMEREQIWEQ
ncbi:hypothetical protein BP6252_09418 [Coleophoma cylindrospora]|uniref:Homologous-pairing protein 2 winged helix domain-containing protein n=1 Tax=Coleophoma cylindrospora TaxID=1849047 RepID=A0A3D8R1V2_9HELO|nr:hypothetical protein BP6252_09418 [Coleophoma cylindrospora]